jgi:hypothetical protein
MAARDTVSPPTVSEQADNREEKRRPPLRRLQTKGVMWVAVALAIMAALAYVMIEVGVLAVGPATEPAGIVYTAAGGYLLGGLQILVRRRWLWMIGAGINALVILFFVSAYHGQPAIFFSPGGLVSKAVQVLLEVCLLYLIVTYQQSWKWRERG